MLTVENLKVECRDFLNMHENLSILEKTNKNEILLMRNYETKKLCLVSVYHFESEEEINRLLSKISIFISRKEINRFFPRILFVSLKKMISPISICLYIAFEYLEYTIEDELQKKEPLDEKFI